MARTLRDLQQDFAISSGLRSEIIWDSLSSDQCDILKQKIETLVPDDSSARTAKVRADLFKSVWIQRKYTNRNLLSSIIYVTVAATNDLATALVAKQFSCHPVFRTRKCINNDGSSTGCCMVFVDEHGRIYRNWAEYLECNVLPSGTMVGPLDGVYTLAANGEVQLMGQRTPQAGQTASLVRFTDRLFTATNVLAALPLLASMTVTLAPPVMAGAMAAAATSSAYSAVRSVWRLKDRHQHGQATGIGDGEARTEWLGIASGVAGLGAMGASQALTAIGGQEISLGTKLMVQGITVSSIVLSGSGVAHGVYDLYMKYSDEEPISSLDVLRLASSLLVFTHSLNNLRLASRVTTNGKGSTLRRQVSGEIRKSLRKLCRETERIVPTATRKYDVLRVANDIPLKEVLMQLPLLNAHLPSQLFSLVTAVSALPSGLLRVIDDSGLDVNVAQMAVQYGAKFVQHIGNMNSLNDVLVALLSYLGPEASNVLMRLTGCFVDNLVDSIDCTLKTFLSTEVVLYKILMHCVRNYTDFSSEFLEGKAADILSDMKSYFLSLDPRDSTNQRQKCPHCDGYYTECEL